ncbi:MAG: DUF2974 domain-containing protein [Neisseria sp.]|uniref:Mbeg1-like protein n=1 Tax=Neisseria sp. TaxID=192066 RepID=UPI0026DB0015|nr:Mbeg1-like protein [Neisseria sp.]MDO4640893.1 DUF2974 domain-containing protein [Neisseria sp.]
MRALNNQDFALLSNHIYGDKDGKLVFDNSEGNITLNGITYKVVGQPYENKSNGYFGAVYQRQDTKELIVVHRGSQDITDIKTDMLMARDHTNRQYKDAEFLTKIAEAFGKVDNVPIYQTGYSLGGSLAELCGNNFNQQTYTFNAFGAANLKEAKPNSHAAQLITNHRMGGDFVAAGAPHLGKEIVYAKPEEIQLLKNGGYGNSNPKDNKLWGCPR